ncbi:ABC transporter ATP-binding protein [Pedobacter sp. B4-66]|uniref:ABC transporter ATP-binding protein n=1 Tax=Pedobacter sp. B4-66 TaxID=2817280 RepID=UPI001BD947C0|nr:ABC transporter ATP-binding protein [Pedobacter sp. B4-66]
MIRLQNFKKSYGQYTALQIPELHLEAGIYWIKGVNGSGKSTLLKSMAGMLSFQGDILINNQTSLKKHPVKYRKMVNFSEAEPLFPTFITGLEMIDLFLSAKNAQKSQKENLIEALKMQHYIQTPVSSYSSGMLKKLSILLAFIGNPSIILLDEPLITIDTDSLKVLYSLIHKEHNQKGTTFLITSHQPLDPAYLPNTKALLVEEHTLKIS